MQMYPQVEAMQLWRQLAQLDIPVQLSLDDVYPALCHLYIVPEAARDAGAAPKSTPGPQPAEGMEAGLAAAALELAAALARHSVR